MTAVRLSLLCLPLTLALLGPAEKARYTDRWVYAAFNLQVEKNADELIALMKRAARSGYTGVVLADYKFQILDRVPEHYFRNAARVKAAAAELGLELIPTVCPIGYSSGLLAHDPNLAAGVPVKGAPFLVKGGEAVLAPDAPARYVNGGLEDVKGDRFAGLAFQDDPGKTTFADRETVHSGKVACRMQDVAKHSTAGGNCRLTQRVKVRPWACYRFSCWVKAQDFRAGEFKLLALGTRPGGRALTFFGGHLEPTQDWHKVEVVFNSLDEAEVNLYVGQWGGKAGTLWIDDLALEELALVNVLRREACPLTVASADGATVYEEGRDFAPVRDPKLGMVPYAGEYEFDHPGAPLRLTPNSRIRDGDRLRVSWYHPIITHGFQVGCSLTDEKVFTILRNQVRRVNDLLRPKTFFLSHDEMRVAGWDQAEVASGRTPGQMLAANVRRCAALVREVAPGARLVVWSDMFDPHHNAVDHYYLVNGTLKGSWEGLPTELVIANWNGGKAKESLQFFAGRGHAQVIAGYYDSDLDNFRHWDAAAQGVPRVIGFTYTTWQHRYQLLEEFGKALRGGD
jgi:hypothetical protein